MLVLLDDFMYLCTMKTIVIYVAGHIKKQAVLSGQFTMSEAQRELLRLKRPCFRVLSVEHK